MCPADDADLPIQLFGRLAIVKFPIGGPAAGTPPRRLGQRVIDDLLREVRMSLATMAGSPPLLTARPWRRVISRSLAPRCRPCRPRLGARRFYRCLRRFAPLRAGTINRCLQIPNRHPALIHADLQRIPFGHDHGEPTFQVFGIRPHALERGFPGADAGYTRCRVGIVNDFFLPQAYIDRCSEFSL